MGWLFFIALLFSLLYEDSGWMIAYTLFLVGVAITESRNEK